MTHGIAAHIHNHCSHALQYCEVCDVVYCLKCNKEWATRSLYIYGYPAYPYTYDSTSTVTVSNYTGHDHK